MQILASPQQHACSLPAPRPSPRLRAFKPKSSSLQSDGSPLVAAAAAAAPAGATATEAHVSHSAPPQQQDKQQQHQQQEQQHAATPFNWHKQWWPVAILDQLDPGVPNQVQLLGMDLVLWRDNSSQWRAFRDCCPHRLAPLSEGRIDSKTGNLYCNYHGWEFDASGSCANIPHLPEGSKPPNPKRSCAQAFPTMEAEQLLWIWGDSSSAAADEAAATPAALLAPEITQFGSDAFWSTKLGIPGQSVFLGFWYQRFCNASYSAVKSNVFNDPSHDNVLHHGQGGLNRDQAKPEVVEEYSFDDKGYKIKRVKASGAVVWETCRFPSSTRRDFAGDPRFGGGIGYVTPTTKGRCNMLLAIVRHPEFAAKPQTWWLRLLEPLLPATPEWCKHVALHDVVDADVTMQHGLDINHSRGLGPDYMPAVGVDQGVIAFRRWLQRFGGGGPPTDNEDDWKKGGPETPLPRRELLDRYNSHTKHCRHCSAALKNFQTVHQAAATLAQLLAAAAIGVAAVGLVQAAGAAAGAPGFLPAALLLAAAAGAAAGLARWADGFIQRFIFIDYDKYNVSKV